MLKLSTNETCLKYFIGKLSSCRIFLLFDLLSSYSENLSSKNSKFVFPRSSTMNPAVGLKLQYLI
jgi:hypothetical protein